MFSEDWADIASAKSFAELLIVALRILNRIDEDEVGIVCGPISTGGLGTIRDNLVVFNQAIQTLQHAGHKVFDQMPFEDAIQRLKDPNISYDMRILTEFYAKIFESGHITVQYFIHNYLTSRGAIWEHEQAEKRGIKRVYLGENYLPLAS